MAKKVQKSNSDAKEPRRGRVILRNITDEMKESYLDYAMSVITARALPDVRDGLKPVHRRILYAMHGMGLSAGSRFRKSAAIVGDTLGKYHPHGDTSVYDALVKLAQPFSSRYPLVLGQGNFGSVDGDSAAAMRYCVTGDTLLPTEQGLTRIRNLAPREGECITASVLSFNKKIHSASRWFDSGVHPIIRIRTANGYTIRGTYNHPLLVWTTHTETGMPQYEWKLLNAVTEGDIVVLDRSSDILWPKEECPLTVYHPKTLPPRTQKKTLPTALTEDLSFILGALTAEGTIKEKKIEFCNADDEFIAAFASAWERVFPDCRLHTFRRKATSFGKKPFTILEIHSLHVIMFLRAIGLAPKKSAFRAVPHTILASTKAVVAAFLRAYYEGDGSVSYADKMNEVSAVSSSQKLLEEIQIILLRFGLVSALRFDRHREIHKLYIRGLHNYVLFEEQIGFAGVRKRTKLSNLISRLQKNASISDFIPHLSTYVRSNLKRAYGAYAGYLEKHNFDRYDNLEHERETIVRTVQTQFTEAVDTMTASLLNTRYFFDPVVAIEDAGEEQVYSIKVESACHSFVGNGFINHNTEAKMSRIASELLRDIEKETIEWRPNYDGTHKEPVVLPSVVPNVLLGGALGIAVGMATNIPPHNLREVTEATAHLIDNKDATTEDLLAFVHGPDFPTGGIAFNEKDIAHAYASGRGGVVVRGEADIDETKNGELQIIISSLPYRVNKAEFVARIAEHVRDKKLDGVKALRDESSRGEMRVAIDIKSNAQPQAVLNYLYKHTDLETTFHYNMLALIDGVPRTFSLKAILEEFIKHRVVVVRRRTEFDLSRAKERAHILEGLKKALDNIDKVITTIRKSRDKEEAHANLRKMFRFSDAQTTAILEMRLQKLAGLERKAVENELEEKRELIKGFEALLGSAQKILGVIKDELKEAAERYGDERKTKIVKRGVATLGMEDIIPEEESALVLTRGGYIKRTNPNEYRRQKRGGVGVMDLSTKEEDFITTFLTASTHDFILFFSNKGKVYQTRMYEIPEGRRATRGKSIMNFLPLSQDEFITSVLAVPKEVRKQQELSLVMVTTRGTIKKVAARSLLDVRRSGIIAITLKNGDTLFSTFFVRKGDDIILVTSKGQSVRFKESQVREMGRGASGVRGIKLSSGDVVVGADGITKELESPKLLVMSAKGYGKRTPLTEYKVQARGGIGIKTARLTGKTGSLVGAKVITDAFSEFVAVSKHGTVIRSSLKEISTLRRATQGVRAMKLRSGDEVATFITL